VHAYRESGDETDSAPYEALVDAIEDLRPYGAEDRLSERILQRRADSGANGVLDAQLDVWHPGDAALAGEWLVEAASAVDAAGGHVLDTYRNDVIGVSLVRAQVPTDALDGLAKLDQLAMIDGVPRPAPRPVRPREATPDDLPAIEAPDNDAPLVGLVDSGVRSAHPLLASCVYDATTLSNEFADGEDQHGHGTRIAALLLHGPLDDVLERGTLPAPPYRVLSVRVLDQHNYFPDQTVWEAEVERAVRHCAAHGVRVINLSIGDPDTPYRGAHSTPLAAILDQLARELDLVIVAPTGNVAPVVYSQLGPQMINNYVRELLQNPHTAMIDPAPSVCSLTVGALATDALPAEAARAALGQGGWVAPFSRKGPGIDGAIKPELAASGGSLAWDRDIDAVVDDPSLEILSAAGAPDRLLDSDIGTSYSVPLVARVAGSVAARYGEFSANLIRALTLVGAEEVAADAPLVHLSEGEMRSAQRQLLGYGQASLSRSVASTDHRTILVADGRIGLDTISVYEVPIPSSFHESGGRRGIDVALAFDPPTRARRLDYAAVKMQFWLVRCLSAEQIAEVFMRASPEDLDEADDDAEDGAEVSGSEEGGGGDARPPTASKLKRNQIKLDPSNRARSRGANQLARRAIGQRIPEEDGDTFHLVVQCRSVWPAPGVTDQAFGLAVALWRDQEHAPIYDELRARVEVPVEIEVRR
jgi:subtilisin family serine protease